MFSRGWLREAWRQWRECWHEAKLARMEAELARSAVKRNERRALVLLLKQLNHEQRSEFRLYRFFHVTGGSSGNRYRIRVDAAANIDVLHPDTAVKYRLCASPPGVPVYGAMAGQLLHLQDPAGERRFLQLANIHPAYPPPSGIIA